MGIPLSKAFFPFCTNSILDNMQLVGNDWECHVVCRVTKILHFTDDETFAFALNGTEYYISIDEDVYIVALLYTGSGGREVKFTVYLVGQALKGITRFSFGKKKHLSGTQIAGSNRKHLFNFLLQFF